MARRGKTPRGRGGRKPAAPPSLFLEEELRRKEALIQRLEEQLQEERRARLPPSIKRKLKKKRRYRFSKTRMPQKRKGWDNPIRKRFEPIGKGRFRKTPVYAVARFVVIDPSPESELEPGREIVLMKSLGSMTGGVLKRMSKKDILKRAEHLYRLSTGKRAEGVELLGVVKLRKGYPVGSQAHPQNRKARVRSRHRSQKRGSRGKR